MICAKVARLGAHRANIDRYRMLLETNLSYIERQFIERRLKEEAVAITILSEGDSSPASIVIRMRSEET